MQLKRYRVQTVAEALERARVEMGPDALVLSTRIVRAGGLRGLAGGRCVEVTVAIERDVSDVRPPRPAARHRGEVEDGIVARLQAGGMDLKFAREVASGLPRSARRGASVATLRAAIAGRLAGLAAGDEGHAPVEVFVGPPGAGKTTTIAKICAQERARRGKRISLVAADSYRVGAIEQLRTYAEIIGSPFMVAHSPSDLERALASGNPPMLVDTPGRSPHDATSRGLFAAVASKQNVRTHLVIPAGTSPSDGARILGRYEDARPDRVVLTRVDEAETISPLVCLLRDRGLPVSYIGTGQRVPEDLYVATAPLLAACVLGENVAAVEALR